MVVHRHALLLIAMLAGLIVAGPAAAQSTTPQWIKVVDPPLITPDFGFQASPKGLVVDAVFQAGTPAGLGVAVVGQTDVQAGVPGGSSAQGARGDIRLQAPVEGYGVFGYAVFQHPGSHGAGALAVAKNESAVGVGRFALAAGSEGTYAIPIGILVFSTESGNAPANGIQVRDATQAGILVATEFATPLYGIQIMSAQRAGILLGNGLPLSSQNARGSVVQLILMDAYSNTVIPGAPGEGLYQGGVYIGGSNPAANPVHIRVNGVTDVAIEAGLPNSCGTGYRCLRVLMP
jgi:hypothetical protein